MSTHDGRDRVVDEAISAARHARRAGPDDRCADCGTVRQLRRVDDVVLCYQCRAVRSGRQPYEDDHLAGRTSWGSLTVRLWRNDHRTVSELRAVLGFDDLPDAEGDVILLLAHLVAGLATLLALLVDYLVVWAAGLRERYGPDYFAGLPSPVVA